MKRLILLIILVGLGIGGWYAYSEYNRKPAGAGELTTDFLLTADELQKAFENEDAATAKYLNKVLEVKGIVAAVVKNENAFNISLETADPMTAVTVQLLPEQNGAAEKITVGQEIMLKGICNGKLADIELNKGVITTK